MEEKSRVRGGGGGGGGFFLCGAACTSRAEPTFCPYTENFSKKFQKIQVIKVRRLGIPVT